MKQETMQMGVENEGAPGEIAGKHWPGGRPARSYAAALAELPTREQRIAALEKVPAEIRALVRRHVECRALLWPHRRRIIQNKVRSLSLLPSWQQQRLLNEMAPWLRHFVSEGLAILAAQSAEREP